MSNRPKRSSTTPPKQPRNNTGMVLIVAGVVLAVIIGFVAIGALVGDGGSSSGAKPTTPSTTVKTSEPPTAPSTTGTTSSLPPLHCTPPPPLPKNPQQWNKPPSKTLAENATWRWTLNTNCGDIVIDLDGKVAPQTVSSFIFLTQNKYFDHVPCHRLTTSGLWVLQCGDPTGKGSGGPGFAYGIENAPPDGEYPTGTVAMARTSDPNSNGSQFFIVYQDTTLPTQDGGYSIFGKVVEGMPIVQAIAAKGLAQDQTAPAQPVSILSASIEKL